MGALTNRLQKSRRSEQTAVATPMVATRVATPSCSRSTVGRVAHWLGPGIITGASDDDPSGIATYAQAGAALGTTVLWTALVTFPMMWTVQFICAKIGMITGTGIARVLRHHYPRWVLYAVVGSLVVANTINAGVDIGAIAAAIHLVAPVSPSTLIVPIALGILALQIWCSYRFIARVFQWLTVALFAYIASAFFAHPDWRTVLHGTVVPSLRMDRASLTALVGILGTTITPYLFFWQANQQVEEEISMGRTSIRDRRGATTAELLAARWDVGIGMLFSNAVMYFIILATASTLFPAGRTNIQTATDAAEALRPLAGVAAEWLFALGLIGAGILCVPILTGSAAYAVAETLGWRHGMNEKPERATAFYGVIAASTIVGIAINFAGINPITALVWTAVLNGFLAPPVLIVVMLLANNRAVLGEDVNGPLLNICGWLTTLAMCAAAIGLLVVTL